MDHRQLFADAASRPVETAAVVLADLDQDVLHARPLDRGSSIAWLVWHAARQMDAQLAELTGRPTVWERDDWADRMGVHRAADDFGLGDSPEQVAALQVGSPEVLRAYLAACTAALTAYADTLAPADLDEIVDRSWTPPVSRGTRLVSLVDDAVAHLGQAAYVRGLVEGWSIGV